MTVEEAILEMLPQEVVALHLVSVPAMPAGPGKVEAGVDGQGAKTGGKNGGGKVVKGADWVAMMQTRSYPPF